MSRANRTGGLSKPETGLLDSLIRRFKSADGKLDTFVSTLPRLPVSDAVRRVLADRPDVIFDQINPHSLHPKATLSLHVSCWSPSLHWMRCVWPIDVATAGARGAPRRQREVDADVATEMARHVAIQDMRRERARDMGLGEPMMMPDEGVAASTPDSARIDHLVIDRHLLSIVQQAASKTQDDAACEPEAMLQQLRYDAASTHSHMDQTGTVARGENAIRRTPTIICDVRLPDGSTAGMLRPTHVLSGSGTVVAYDGHGLIVLTEMPETALTAATGRPLGDLIRTGTSLDARIVEDTRSTTSGFAISMAPDLVRIGDLPDRRVTALDILAMPPARKGYR
jgi:hypothetical protein